MRQMHNHTSSENYSLNKYTIKELKGLNRILTNQSINPNAQKVNKLAKRVFGYSLDLENITENKAKKLQKNLNEQVKIYETKLGSKAQTSKKYYEMKLVLRH